MTPKGSRPMQPRTMTVETVAEAMSIARGEVDTASDGAASREDAFDPYRQTPFDPHDHPAADLVEEIEEVEWHPDDDARWRPIGRFDWTHLVLTALAAFLAGALAMSMLGAG